MQKYLTTSLFILLFSLSVHSQNTDQEIVIDERKYTLHKVEPGETLFSISKKYGLSVDQLKLENRLGESNSIDIERLLIIPLYARLDKAEQKELNKTSTSFFTHKVEKGETLYSIARDYNNVKPAQIKLMNNLKSDTLRIGMLLEIPQNPEDIEKETFKAKNDTIIPGDSQKAINERALFKSNSDTLIQAVDTASRNSFLDRFDKKSLIDFRTKFESIDTLKESYEVDRGVGVWFDSFGESGKGSFFALHKSAALGSVLKVRNLMNNRVVYVKVIGKLPAAERNSGIIIKISEATAQFLNILDEKFLVEIIEKKERR